MNVYVETNFVLELAFAQEQWQSCDNILSDAECGKIRLVLPSYCLAEPLEKLKRQEAKRRQLQNDLKIELKQLKRTSPYESRIDGIQDIADLLVQSSEEERKRFANYRDRLLSAAEVIPLTSRHVPYLSWCFQ
ncbi:PIN domain-containing protein [Methylomagnum sp.]